MWLDSEPLKIQLYRQPLKGHGDLQTTYVDMGSQIKGFFTNKKNLNITVYVQSKIIGLYSENNILKIDYTYMVVEYFMDNPVQHRWPNHSEGMDS